MSPLSGEHDDRLTRRAALSRCAALSGCAAWGAAGASLGASLAAAQSPGADAHDLGKFSFPLEYGGGEKEGEGLLCPGYSPGIRVLVLARHLMELKVVGAQGQKMHVRAVVPCLRNLGEQRRLASKVTVRVGTQTLSHEAKLIYTRPFQNPFLQIEFESESGTLEVEVDSWLSHAAPPGDPSKTVKMLLLKPPEGAKALAAFLERRHVAPSPHWWTDASGKLPPKPLSAGAEGGAGLKSVYAALRSMREKVQFDPDRSVTAPDDALEGGGDSIAQASFNWYCLQNELWTGMVAGFCRHHVQAGYTALHAWNVFNYHGLLVGDASGNAPYLGPDNVTFLPTSFGSDHDMTDHPGIPRHHPLNGGMWWNRDGEIECTRLASLIGLSALGRLQKNGKVVVSTAAGETAKGLQQAELNAWAANPPKGIVELANLADAARRRG